MLALLLAAAAAAYVPALCSMPLAVDYVPALCPIPLRLLKSNHSQQQIPMAVKDGKAPKLHLKTA